MTLPARPHDLLALAEGAEVLAENSAEQPALEDALRMARMVVVRRGELRNGWLPVGVRGGTREQRFAAWLQPQDVQRVIAPEALRVDDAPQRLPALQALQQLQSRWSWCELAWGPTGSVGFALASSADVVTAESDLDIVLRAPRSLAEVLLRRLAEALHDLPCRVDVQVATPLGSVALAELLVPQERVLLRAAEGVALVADPWATAVAP